MIYNKSGIAFPDYQNKKGQMFTHTKNHDVKQWEYCLKHIKNFRTCIEFGAHVGTSAIQYSKAFEKIISFEPLPDLFECLSYNTKDLHNVEIHNFAISDTNGFTDIFVNPANSGSNVIESDETSKLIKSRWGNQKRKAFIDSKPIQVETRTIDSFGFTDVDFIKIDTEGFNIQPLMGMAETLRNNSPVVMMELGQGNNPGKKYLISMGYKLLGKIDIDEIYIKE